MRYREKDGKHHRTVRMPTLTMTGWLEADLQLSDVLSAMLHNAKRRGAGVALGAE